MVCMWVWMRVCMWGVSVSVYDVGMCVWYACGCGCVYVGVWCVSVSVYDVGMCVWWGA